jgi:integrase
MAPERVSKRFAELVKAAGLRPIRLHDLWQGQASLMLAAGVPMAVVSKRLSHSTIALTADLYLHLWTELVATRQNARRLSSHERSVTNMVPNSSDAPA